jgi:heme-degrading monooxygenase HmoA
MTTTTTMADVEPMGDSMAHMGHIASFHLVREVSGAPGTVRNMAALGLDRRHMARVEGCLLWRLMGTGRGDDTAPSVDMARRALFALWRSEADLERFVARSPVVARWGRAAESWHVRLRSRGGHGAWRGVQVMSNLEPARQGDGPVAIITRAEVRREAWRRFAAAGRPVNDELRRAPGLLAVVGVGEAPVGRQATFSLWRSLEDAVAFADTMPAHREVVRRTRREQWYGEELFARFEPYGSTGRWDGRDPLNE